MVGDHRSDASTLTAAVRESASRLAISANNLQRILQTGARDAEHLLSGTYVLSQEAPEWDAAVKLVRIVDSLLVLIGDTSRARIWFHGVNTALGAIPMELLASGAVDRVLEYVERARYGS